MGNAIGVFDHLNTWIKNTIKKSLLERLNKKYYKNSYM